MSGVTRDEQDPNRFHVDWSAVNAGRNPWKRATLPTVDPFLVAKAIRQVMKQCPHRTATGKPLVWNEYAVFLDLTDWERIKKLENTLTRDLGEVVKKDLGQLKADMVGVLAVRLLRDEGGTVRPGTSVIKVDFSEGDRTVTEDPGEMTIRIGIPVTRAITDLATQHVPEMAAASTTDGNGLRLTWQGGATSIAPGVRVVLGRPHPGPAPGFVALTGASSKINKRQVWIEAAEDGAVIGRLSEANPVEVAGRLIQPGGQIAIEQFPAEVTLSGGELSVTVDRV
jgi:hypothetical protein